jgi:hypothetical protein
MTLLRKKNKVLHIQFGDEKLVVESGMYIFDFTPSEREGAGG